MTLQELGQSIREKREAAGMSIDDVAARIKISGRILRSIEDGSLVGLPHAVYTKSFIRSFGLLVGYEPEALNTELDQLFPPESLDETRSEPTFRNQTVISYPGAGKRFLVLLVLLLIFGGLLGGSWYVVVNYGDMILETVKKPFSAVSGQEGGDPGEGSSVQDTTSFNGSERSSGELAHTLQALVAGSGNTHSGTGREGVVGGQRSVPPPSPEASPTAGDARTDPSTTISPAHAGVSASETGQQAQAEGAADPNAGGTAARKAETVPEAQSVDVASGMVAATSDRGTTSDMSSAAAHEIAPGQAGVNILVILASESCWVGPRADGVKGRDRTLQPGETYTLTYNRTLEVVLGNAGGVTLTLNGMDSGRPGRSGQRTVLRYP